jgi:hypothetical protein
MQHNLLGSYDITGMLIDQLMILKEGMSIAIRYLSLLSASLAVHHMILYYSKKMKGLTRDRMYDLNMEALHMLKKMTYAIQRLNNQGISLCQITSAVEAVQRQVELKIG